MVNEIVIREDLPLGVWQGLGGAITEATAYNFAKLSPKKQQKFLDAYYSKKGLDYRWGRLSIGSNDFCVEPFLYTSRVDLEDFSIEHDQKWLLPMMKKILSQKKLTLLASPWSPPRCMKFVRKGRFDGILKPWCYDNYAEYIHRWLEAYAKEGIKINYLTPQNEPFASQIWESCTFSFRAQRRLVDKYLAKTLGDFDTKILLWDHNKEELPKVADELLGYKYRHQDKIAGLCYHWYDGTFPEKMWQVKQKYPEALIISSEMCCYFTHYDEKEWQNDANLYLSELFHDINTGASAFIDWNMLLDAQGGPNHVKNYTKSPIILNRKGDDFILTPIYAALKKFARLFPAGSEVVRCEYSSDDIVAIARKTKSGYRVVVANVSGQKQQVAIRLGSQKKNLTLAKFEIGGVMWT